jgi:hypothetical protein
VDRVESVVIPDTKVDRLQNGAFKALRVHVTERKEGLACPAREGQASFGVLRFVVFLVKRRRRISEHEALPSHAQVTKRGPKTRQRTTHPACVRGRGQHCGRTCFTNVLTR